MRNKPPARRRAFAACQSPTRVFGVELRSGGEQQRLGFARLLYQRPSFALLDESTSAMDSSLEERCMRAAIAAGITCISVGHRPTLRAFHASCLTLDGAGGAVLTPIDSAAVGGTH